MNKGSFSTVILTAFLLVGLLSIGGALTFLGGVDAEVGGRISMAIFSVVLGAVFFRGAFARSVRWQQPLRNRWLHVARMILRLNLVVWGLGAFTWASLVLLGESDKVGTILWARLFGATVLYILPSVSGGLLLIGWGIDHFTHRRRT